jgi:hypothetical protein
LCNLDELGFMKLHLLMFWLLIVFPFIEVL